MSDENKDLIMEAGRQLTEHKERLDSLENRIKSMVETDTSNQDRIIELERKFTDVKLGNTSKILNQNKIVADYAELKEQIAELKAIEKVSLDTIEVISKDYKNIKEVLLKYLQEIGHPLWEKLEAPQEQMEKKEVCEACLYTKRFDTTKICGICIPNSKKSKFKPKASGGSKCENCKRREFRCETDIEFRRMCLKTNRNWFDPKASGGEKEMREAGTRMEPSGNFKGSTQINSKLPEPKKVIRHCQDYNNGHCSWLGGKCEDHEDCKLKETKEKTENDYLTKLTEGQATTEPENILEFSERDKKIMKVMTQKADVIVYDDPKEDVRAIEIKGKLYWMPKAEADQLIEEFLKFEQELINKLNRDRMNSAITKVFVIKSMIEHLVNNRKKWKKEDEK